MTGIQQYEAVSRFAQQGGRIYFALLFLAGVIYALWPRNKEAFQRLARLPLEDDESDDV
jgi:cytochrome c oxidase cbb3-type subunit IV